MDDLSVFRWLTIAIFVANLLITASHRAAAHRAAGGAVPVDRAATPPASAEGRLVWMRPIGLVLWLVLLAYLVEPAWMGWASVRLPRAVSWVGVALSAVSVLLISWALRHLGRNFSRDVVPPANATLVTTGPYAFVRHPWYASLLVFLGGLALIWSSWLLATLVVARAVYYAKRGSIEERALSDLFGERYQQYARGLPRFFPGV